MAIIWTKDWDGSDDGSIVGGIDLKNIQGDLSNVVQTNDSPTFGDVTVNDVTAAAITADSITLTDGVIIINETTTPAAVANVGKIYTKSDNKLYFQDGSGVEHEIAVV